jgi:hypothetical protein
MSHMSFCAFYNNYYSNLLQQNHGFYVYNIVTKMIT